MVIDMCILQKLCIRNYQLNVAAQACCLLAPEYFLADLQKCDVAMLSL